MKIYTSYLFKLGTELAISESQERMACVVRAKDAERFIKEAEKENARRWGVKQNVEEENVYILVDNELNVQNFTPNAPKLLCLHSSAINNNLEVTEYIKEFKQEFLKEMEKNADSKENNWKYIKHKKKNF